MNILITGGAGLIGSNLLKALLNQSNNNIFVVDNLWRGKLENISFLQDKFLLKGFVFGSLHILIMVLGFYTGFSIKKLLFRKPFNTTANTWFLIRIHTSTLANSI